MLFTRELEEALGGASCKRLTKVEIKFVSRYLVSLSGITFSDKSQTSNTKTSDVGVNESKNSSFPSLFAVFESVV